MTHYCKAPWTALFVHPNGGVKSCCAGEWDWGNLKENTVEEILQDPKIVKLKQDILDGVPNDFCKICARGEEMSGSSQRSYFDKFSISDEQLQDVNAFELQSLDVRWSNLCNLACVYCCEDWSTSWQQIKGIPISPAIVDYHDNILNYITARAQGVESIILAGGEPLLHKQNIKLLESLPESTHIDIITNLSINVERSRVFQLLDGRPNVHWSISMEGLGDRFEYVRQRAEWDQMCANLERIKGQNITLFPVYCIYSVSQLREYYQFAADVGANIHWQQLVGPDHLNVFNFSQPVRQYAHDQIAQLLSDPIMQTVKNHDGFLDYVQSQLLLNDPVKTQDHRFRLLAPHYEKTLSKNWTTIWPELDAIIQP
jgi:MoaA/NifB/PqqE/SkfB family radical SAM enzyme